MSSKITVHRNEYSRIHSKAVLKTLSEQPKMSVAEAMAQYKRIERESILNAANRKPFKPQEEQADN